jgi:hypothetical protein
VSRAVAMAGSVCSVLARNSKKEGGICSHQRICHIPLTTSNENPRKGRVGHPSFPPLAKTMPMEVLYLWLILPASRHKTEQKATMTQVCVYHVWADSREIMQHMLGSLSLCL